MKAIFIMYVHNQEKSKDFYKNIFQKNPVLDVPGMTEFEINKYSKLGIMPESGITNLLGNAIVNPASGNGIPRCELYLYVDSPEEYYRRALGCGAKPISEPLVRNWGDKVAYCSDLDGNILAFAQTIEN